MANSLGSFDFITANVNGERGGMPPIVQQQIGLVQRAGVAGSGFVQLGVKGQPFQLVTTADVASVSAGVALGVSYQEISRDEAQELVWCDVTMFETHSTKYFVASVDQVKCRRTSSATGGLLGTGAGAIVSAVWTLVPVYEAPPE